MGGLPLHSIEPVKQIKDALSAHSSGDTLPFHRLQHGLSSKDSSTLSAILTGLTHFTTTLHHTSPHAQLIRQLVETAMSIDLFACVTEPSALPALLTFCKNLCSAHAASIEPLLRLIVGRSLASSISDPRSVQIRSTAIELVSFILDTHPRAASVLVSAIRKKYPHPVRPAAEHAAFARGVLCLARNVNIHSVSDALVGMVIDRLASTEALAGDDVLLMNVLPSKDKKNNLELTPEASRVQSIVMELFTYIDERKQCDKKEKNGENASIYAFEQIFAAYEKYIIPIEKTRIAPYVLLYAGEHAGEDQILETVERLREAFFDCSFSSRLRGKFLEHSSVLVTRSRSVSSSKAFRWISNLAKWLNAYIDAQQRDNDDDETTDIDTDIHYLFYQACCMLMVTIARRRDAFEGKGEEYRDVIAKMRLYRIMASDLNPMLVIPRQVVMEFVNLIEDLSGSHFRELMISNNGKFIASRTAYGSRNVFEYSLRCPDLLLPEAREKLDKIMRWDKDAGLKKNKDSKKSVVGGDKISKIQTKAKPSKRKTPSIGAPMIPLTSS